jgi:uncharacterized Fe-S cluster-containing radical SAM superfamily protein
MTTINTEEFSISLRNKAIDLDNRRIQITNYHGSLQEQDLTEPANCDGYGRIRHFKIKAGENWPLNPLPIVPAQKYLGLSHLSEIKAQVFQNSICNWRCWYCFVDFKLLSGNKKYSTFLTCEQLLDLYLKEDFKPVMIDLSGGQPDLTPEWVPWMMQALKNRNLSDKIFLWSDDNLSNDYFWKYLSVEHMEIITSYKMYARVCCFKGIDERSFVINTQAAASQFDKQFDLFKRLWKLGVDLYAYITLTAPSDTDFNNIIPRFLDRIQQIDEKIPLKIVPLRIFEFSPSKERKNVDKKDLLLGQMKAVAVWQKEIERRFALSQRELPIHAI